MRVKTNLRNLEKLVLETAVFCKFIFIFRTLPKATFQEFQKFKPVVMSNARGENHENPRRKIA